MEHAILSRIADLVEDATSPGRITIKVSTAVGRSIKRTADVKESDLRERPATTAKKLMDHRFIPTAAQPEHDPAVALGIG